MAVKDNEFDHYNRLYNHIILATLRKKKITSTTSAIASEWNVALTKNTTEVIDSDVINMVK